MSRRTTALMLGLLATLVLYLYLPVRDSAFLNYDDNVYVTENRHVLAGISREGLGWAFTDIGTTGNWHPLAWVSHMLDVQFFQLNAGRHHLVSLLLHLTNTLLLFLFLRSGTGAYWRSALVAALFAVHPLHVESVAWLSERKDVLSTFFGLLALIVYVRYARKGGVSRYLLVVLLFALGIMAKPMLVTLPMVFLLLDYWPLGRLHPGRTFARHPSGSQAGGRSFVPLVLEKLPLLVISIATGVVAYIAQARSDAITAFGSSPLQIRLANAVISYCMYILKAIWPQDLAMYYPFPTQLPPWWQIAAGVLVLSGVTVFALRNRQALPCILVGWFWYVGTLVPVIGLVRLGGQAMADRYTYVPLVGLFLLVAWGVWDLAKSSVTRAYLVAAISVVSIGAFFVVAAIQIRYWRDDVTLFRHTLLVTKDNWPVENNLGRALMDLGRLDEALGHIRRSIQINPGHGKAYVNLGTTLARAGRTAEAVSTFKQALQIDRGNAEAHYNLAALLADGGRSDEAERHYRAAIRIAPASSDAYTNLAGLLINRRSYAEAESLLRQALLLNPRDEIAHLNLGALKQIQGKIEEAVVHYRAALALRPDLAGARRNLERLHRLP